MEESLVLTPFSSVIVVSVQKPTLDAFSSVFLDITLDYLFKKLCPEIMHKYGLANGYFHDTGIVLDKNPYIVIILTREGDRKYVFANLSPHWASGRPRT